MASTPQSSARPGHLDTTWEVAVISSCIVIFVVAISVVICQLRRQRRRSRLQDEEARQNIRKRSGDPEKVENRTVPVLERGGEQTGDSGQEQDEDYTDLEDEEQPDYTKPKRNSTSSKSKPTRSKKHHLSSRKSDSSTSETEVVSHPSQMPPKYYWNHR